MNDKEKQISWWDAYRFLILITFVVLSAGMWRFSYQFYSTIDVTYEKSLPLPLPQVMFLIPASITSLLMAGILGSFIALLEKGFNNKLTEYIQIHLSGTFGGIIGGTVLGIVSGGNANQIFMGGFLGVAIGNALYFLHLAKKDETKRPSWRNK